MTAGGIVVSRPHSDPFPWRPTWVTLGIVLTSSALVLSALPDSGTLGRATWYLGANTWLLWFLILRRRVRVAWLGGTAMVVETMLWSELAGRGALSGLSLAVPQVLLVVIATLFGQALRRSSARINAFAQRTIDAAAAAGAVEAARAVQDQRADELAETVLPILMMLASEAPLTDQMREEVIRVEAQLRDSVRGRGLALPPIVAAATRARSRGVNVTLLDDLGEPLSEELAASVVGAVERALDSASAGTVTVRLLPPGREEMLTIVSQEAGEIRRVALPRVAVA